MPDQTPEHIQGAGPNDQKIELHPEVATTGVQIKNDDQARLQEAHDVLSEVKGAAVGSEVPVSHANGALDHRPFETPTGAEDTGRYNLVKLKLQNEIVKNTGIQEE